MIERYELLRELGRGGMAVVHLARQIDLERLIALKELSGFNSGDEAMAERFLRESRTAGSLNHPGIVTVYDYFEDDGTPFISMELVPGGSLRPLLGELSLQQSALVLEQLLGALDFAGRQGVVHRDLKPENVLVTEDGRVKVADFGIAKASAAVGGKTANLTGAGMTVGTPAYMSPEQAQASDDISPASDLYAIGCMTFEMLSGRLPFTDRETLKLLVKHVQEPVPDVREVDPFVPEPVAQWIARMTEKDPADRPASATAAWEELEDVLLELFGPRWRRDSELRPAGSIDLSDLPPPGATPPGRPKAAPAPVPGSRSGFETYHAPAALHEVHGGRRADFATPEEPAPAPAPVQVVTPPSAPKVVTPPPQPAQAPVIAPVVEEDAGPRFPAGLTAGVAAVALAVGIGAGIATSGSSTEAVRATGFSLSAPAGWRTADAGAGGAAAGLGDAIAVAPSGAQGADAVVAGRLPEDADELLPRGWSAGRGAARRVRLAGGEALLYRGTRAPDGRRDAYVLPTTSGALVVACPASGPARADCGAVAGSLRPTEGEAVELGPDEGGAQALKLAFDRLRSGTRAPREDLAGASSRAAQSVAAGDLGRAYRQAAVAVSRAELGAAAVPAQRRLRRALSQLSSAWRDFAGAARAGDGGAAGSARTRIARARAAAAAARAELARAGYGMRGAG